MYPPHDKNQDGTSVVIKDRLNEHYNDQTVSVLGHVIYDGSKEGTNDGIQDGVSVGTKDVSDEASNDQNVQFSHPEINEGTREGTNDGIQDVDKTFTNLSVQ